MKKIKYDKLIRDKIPEIIQGDGKESTTHIAEDEEYFQKLQEKLEEEVREFLSSDEGHKIEEVADILEVLYAICDVKGVSREQIEEIRAQKAKNRGGFEKRIILEETTGK
ncbi:MAG: nucleoside triphosphate pyrophosphohydrolase [Candidatus Moraniibacteriota bacterium]